MSQFRFEGIVVPTRYGNSPGLQADDAEALRIFWQEQAIDTQLLEEKGGPVISIGRQSDLAICNVNDRARMTFEVVTQADGKKRIRTIDFVLLPTSN